MLCDWLETQGHEVLSAEDLQTAWRTLGHQEPDLVLLDVQLGNEDALGGTATTAAKTMVTEQQRFLEAGCNACVSKPVSFKLLSEHQGTVASPPRKMPSTR